VRELHVLDLVERRRLKRQFSMTLANKGHVEIYWTPSGKRIIARTVAAADVGSRRTALPDDVHLVGTYAHPFNVNDFLGDLDDLLTKLAHASTTQAVAVRAG
jgi:hypothetical protein